MDSTLQALGRLLLRAVPTFLFIVFLHFYLKSMFFKPLERVRQKRYDSTEGARERARENMERAAARTTEYEAALRMAKAAVYQSQETLYRQLEEQQEAELEAARRDADRTVDEARAALAQDVDAAKERLARNSEVLARQIAESILRRSAA
ncbi:MAG: hypothetical protein KGM92_02500 [Acidobacteriota bacterium]|nr:hypothetical protein [Acidobacteriota bacterium]